MSFWKRTPGSAHSDGKPRWSRTLKRPEGCDKCIEIEKNRVYWVMSARGTIFDGLGNIEKQKTDPVEKEAWEGPRAGFHVRLIFLVDFKNIFSTRKLSGRKLLFGKRMILTI